MEIPEDKSDQPTPFEPLIDSRAAAPFVGVHFKVLERMARKGEVPATKLGRSWMFRLSVLSEWIDHKMRSNSQQLGIDEPKKENLVNEHAEHISNRKPSPRSPR